MLQFLELDLFLSLLLIFHYFLFSDLHQSLIPFLSFDHVLFLQPALLLSQHELVFLLFLEPFDILHASGLSMLQILHFTLERLIFTFLSLPMRVVISLVLHFSSLIHLVLLLHEFLEPLVILYLLGHQHHLGLELILSLILLGLDSFPLNSLVALTQLHDISLNLGLVLHSCRQCLLLNIVNKLISLHLFLLLSLFLHVDD